ncbi:MAG: RNA 3'-terminal phosphate cyclase [Methanosarcinales archaeon]|nr:MAG: RNA 3'-terminal phosphate cyclase [Methanosarcinales archaeon]
MLTIDGSFGEGGGQILRTSVAMAAITETPVKIVHVRKNRPKPGLSAQHLTAIRALTELAGADTNGDEIGSTELTFSPGEIRGGTYCMDIGTAGSISLLLQCLIPVALYAPDTVVLDITGGTDVKWSPPIDHLRHVLLPALALMGCDVNVEVMRRGYYPRGGGRVRAVIEPSRISGADFCEKTSGAVCGCSHSSRLPEHVAKRQRSAAIARLHDHGYDGRIDATITVTPPDRGAASTGSGITLWCGYVGGSALGERGKPAEVVGSDAADNIIRELNSKAAVDIYLADQLIPYMAMAKSGLFTTRELSLHAKTNIWVSEQFTDARFDVTQSDQVVRVVCL